MLCSPQWSFPFFIDAQLETCIWSSCPRLRLQGVSCLSLLRSSLSVPPLRMMATPGLSSMNHWVWLSRISVTFLICEDQGRHGLGCVNWGMFRIDWNLWRMTLNIIWNGVPVGSRGASCFPLIEHLSSYLWMVLDSVCRPRCLKLERSTCFCLLSAGMKDVEICAWLKEKFLTHPWFWFQFLLCKVTCVGLVPGHFGHMHR